MNNIIDLLKNPPKEYRAVPFWSWNDRLDADMMRWQINEMGKTGHGGHMMHARGGLKTEYLSEEWMACVGASIEESEELGLGAWCYDENGWPSGFAGGIVTAKGDGFHTRWLEIEETHVKSVKWNEGILGIYKTNGSCQGIAPEELGKCENDRIYIIRHKSNPYYIDTLNPEVIRAFIEATHEKYYELFKEHFGKGMPGFFTDEPQFARNQIPWSHVLPEAFRKRHGYAIVDRLPALFVECEGYEKIRYDFWDTVSHLFVSSFGKQIYDWCEAHNCQTTGHVVDEDGLYAQMRGTAGAMPFYQYLHIPGMDWLRRGVGSPLIPKQVSSVAEQLGKKLSLTETFGLCGWDVTLEELKWIAEWQYVNGITLMCQHLAGYTLRGMRKRDYPPSLFYQQSWWEEYKLFNDYFARLGALLTSGRSAVDVLLIHPIKSGWIAYDRSNNETLVKLDKDFLNATERLSGLHIGHHYGDETIIKEHGSVRETQFIVGNCSYSIVILPSMLTMDDSTLSLLDEFINNGGKVISFGDFPALCEGVRSKQLDSLKQKVFHAHDNASVYALLTKAKTPAISIAVDGKEIERIHYLQRDLGDSQVFYLVNLSQEEAFHCDVSLQGRGRARRLSVEEVEFQALDYECIGECTRLKLEFAPMQSHVLVFDSVKEFGGKAEAQKESILRLDDTWKIEKMDLNACTLDVCSYSIDEGEWCGPINTIKLMQLLLDLKRPCAVALKFNFEVDMDLRKNNELYLVAETADEFEIQINGSLVEYRDIGWWKDSSFKKIDIKKHVCMGQNELVMRRRFHQSQKVYDVLYGENVHESEVNKLTYDVELESIYLIGDFGVFSKADYSYGDRKSIFTQGPFVLSDRPQTIKRGSLVEQGFCFFAGTITVSQTVNIEKEDKACIKLDMGRPNAAISKVSVNDKLVKALPWAPYVMDVTEYMNEGDNKIEIQLFASNRNLLGPHHYALGESYSVGPSTFTSKPGWCDDKGLTDIWTDRYCFVKFGLK